jgi:hypothetical protein
MPIGNIVGLIVGLMCSVNPEKVLKIVDIYGVLNYKRNVFTEPNSKY